MIIHKMTGLGNNFVIVNLIGDLQHRELKTLLQNKEYRQKRAKFFCNLNFGPGADGIVYVLPGNEDYSFAWDFYNNDGSSAEMCGNAARCVARYAVDHALSEKKSKFLSATGPIEFEVHQNHQVQIKMSPAKVVVVQEKLNENIDYSIINTGVPHVVIRLKDFSDKEQLYALAKDLRYPKQLNSKGANVSFWFKQENGFLKSTSFERGVEGFTLACGTGAVACAVDYFLKSSVREVSLELPGGRLMVNVDAQLKGILMIGPAKYIYKAEINKEWFDE